VVIATESAFFMQAFSKIGLIPDAGRHLLASAPDRRLARAMGAALFAGQASMRAQAAAWGMIWEAVDASVSMPIWRARAAHLAEGPDRGLQADEAGIARQSSGTTR
jgi:2-(1,2-epoxy-1,2-dihydrophenyl)acetyl-CoA isomerase